MEDGSSDSGAPPEDDSTPHGSKLLAIINKLKTTPEEDANEDKNKLIEETVPKPVSQNLVANGGNDVIEINDDSNDELSITKDAVNGKEEKTKKQKEDTQEVEDEISGTTNKEDKDESTPNSVERKGYPCTKISEEDGSLDNICNGPVLGFLEKKVDEETSFIYQNSTDEVMCSTVLSNEDENSKSNCITFSPGSSFEETLVVQISDHEDPLDEADFDIRDTVENIITQESNSLNHKNEDVTVTSTDVEASSTTIASNEKDSSEIREKVETEISGASTKLENTTVDCQTTSFEDPQKTKNPEDIMSGEQDSSCLVTDVKETDFTIKDSQQTVEKRETSISEDKNKSNASIDNQTIVYEDPEMSQVIHVKEQDSSETSVLRLEKKDIVREDSLETSKEEDSVILDDSNVGNATLDTPKSPSVIILSDEQNSPSVPDLAMDEKNTVVEDLVLSPKKEEISCCEVSNKVNTTLDNERKSYEDPERPPVIVLSDDPDSSHISDSALKDTPTMIENDEQSSTDANSQTNVDLPSCCTDIERPPVLILPDNEDRALMEIEEKLKGSFDEDVTTKTEERDEELILADLPEIVMCTACGKKTNPQKRGVSQHPMLGVLVCKSCLRFYNSSPFNRDSNGMEEHCKWCAEGGTLVMCDFCEKVYCEQCIKRNLGKDFYSMLLNADECMKWQCFACDNAQLEQLQAQCNLVIRTLEELKRRGGLNIKKTSNAIDSEERKARLVSLSESLGTPQSKSKTFRLDSPDVADDVKVGQKSVVDKVRKKRIRIFESDEESLESVIQRSSESDDHDSSDNKGKSKRKSKPGPSVGYGKKSSGSKKQKQNKKKSEMDREEESNSNKAMSGLTVKFSFGKSRVRTRRKGKLLADISDPGLGTSKSYANEEYFSSETSDNSYDDEEVKSIPVDQISDLQLKDLRVLVEELDPHKIEAAKEAACIDHVDESEPESTLQGKSLLGIKGNSKPSGKAMAKRTKKLKEIKNTSDSDSDTGEDENRIASKSVKPKSSLIGKNRGKRTKSFLKKRKVSDSETENDVVKIEENETLTNLEGNTEDGEKTKTSIDDKSNAFDVNSKTMSKKKKGMEIESSDDGLSLNDEVSAKEGDQDVSADSLSSDDDKTSPGKGKKLRMSSSLEESESSSDSEDDDRHAERKLRSRKIVSSSESTSLSESDSRGKQASSRKTRLTKTRKRRRHKSSTSEEEEDLESDNSGPARKKRKRKKQKSKKGKQKGRKKKKRSNSDDSESEKETPSKRGRRNIRRILKDEELTEKTQHARQLEEERRKRLLARTETTADGESEDVVEEDTTGFVLERDENGKVLVSVAPQVTAYLKPHQKEGVKFMFDCVVESVKKWKEENYEGGCLLAHCMGLGKTLQVVALIHTLMNCKRIGLSRVLVVAPLNTVLNWQVEFEKWLNVDDRLEVYILNEAGPDRWARTDMLSDWKLYGGILVLGYEMYRNLSQLLRIRSKKQKEIITTALVDPGPELVVCDEGHILRNDQSAISKALNNIKTKRRVVLTGTPLQNNLIEYHCMVNFVKPNLLGTRKEFTNRFVNPILNGQLSNSTASDVRIMKQRCHILHELLSGCVLRRDYSVLTPFLSPKHEYTIFVRLSEKQRTMYQYFLDTFVCKDLSEVKIRGVSLFSDYQCLMRIWTHPFAVKLEAIRRLEREKYFDDKDFLNDESEVSNDESHRYRQGSDSSDFESRTRTTKRRKKVQVSEESEEEEEEEEEEESGKSSDEDDKPIKITSTGRRHTRASAALAAGLIKQKTGHSKESGKLTPTFISPVSRTRKKHRINSDDEGEEEQQEEEIVVVEPSKEPSHKTTRSGSSFKVQDEQNNIPEESEWYDQFLTSGDEHEIAQSGKLVILMEILTDAELMSDKVLVFSQSLVSLDLIEKCLGNGRIGGDSINWCRGVDYFRMDGSTGAQTRQRYAEIFNDAESTCRLFLISTRAGSLGINLVAANRVVIFDCSWNPSHDMQSIFRVYRFGQQKPVFVYRLVSQGTMEEKIYNRQITKMAIAGRVVDEQQIERHFTDEEIRELYLFQAEVYNEGEDTTTPQLPKDPLLAEVVQRQHPQWIVRYHEHDLLLENIEDEKLSEEERKQAWAQYEQEKDANYQSQVRVQMEQERMRERMQMLGQNTGAVPHTRFNVPQSHSAPNLLDGTRITQEQAEALFRHLQFTALPGHNVDRSQVFRQYTDENGRTVTKMQIPPGTNIRMLQPPQDRSLFPHETPRYRIDPLPVQRQRFQIPMPYSIRHQYLPQAGRTGVIYRSGELPSPNVNSLLGFNPYQRRPYSYRPRGPSYRLPNSHGT